MNTIENLLKNALDIETKIGYSFKDRSILALAFVHRSYVNEHREISFHNERLEFLGDAILGLIIVDYLYKSLPTTPEGDLSYLRSRLVEASSCVAYIQQLDLEKYLLLGKGETLNEGRGRETILADLFEAIIGAIYLDGGLEPTKDFIFKNFSVQIDAILKTPLRNWKALLQDYCQKKFQITPIYVVLDEKGPDHNKTFTIAVIVSDNELGRGEGTSKKEAQQAAAAQALTKISNSPP